MCAAGLGRSPASDGNRIAVGVQESPAFNGRRSFLALLVQRLGVGHGLAESQIPARGKWRVLARKVQNVLTRSRVVCQREQLQSHLIGNEATARKSHRPKSAEGQHADHCTARAFDVGHVDGGFVSPLTKNHAPKRIAALGPCKASANFLKACRQDRLAMTGAVHPTRDNDSWTKTAWT